jgi:hypothetical protein
VCNYLLGYLRILFGRRNVDTARCRQEHLS